MLEVIFYTTPDGVPVVTLWVKPVQVNRSVVVATFQPGADRRVTMTVVGLLSLAIPGPLTVDEPKATDVQRLQRDASFEVGRKQISGQPNARHLHQDAVAGGAIVELPGGVVVPGPERAAGFRNHGVVTTGVDHQYALQDGW